MQSVLAEPYIDDVLAGAGERLARECALLCAWSSTGTAFGNPYEEANRSDVEAHHVDDEVERRVRHRPLERRFTAAQDEVVAARARLARRPQALRECVT